MNMLKRIKQKLTEIFDHGIYVTLDGRDNSVTFSPQLAKIINPFALEKDRVFVFRTTDGNYGFMLDPQEWKDQPEDFTQFAHIQCDSRDKSFGFESLNPSVQRIFYDYGYSHEESVRLPVMPITLTTGEIYYKICRKKSLDGSEIR